MKTKAKTVFSCQSCGYQTPKWLGRCPDCGAWNSFIEERFEAQIEKQNRAVSLDKTEPVLLNSVQVKKSERLLIGIRN